LIVLLLLLSGIFTTSYAAISVYVASRLAFQTQVLPKGAPSEFGLQYQNVVFPSRYDHLQLHGWLIPGILPGGALTLQRVIIIVHGQGTNRADPGAGLLDLSSDLARRGFAVLAFDMRGNGESPPAPLSLGYFEQRDVLGAVDFLRSGILPYPALGHPHSIGGLGFSLGAAALLLAAAHDFALKAVVSDSAYSDALPILERDIPLDSYLPSWFTPGVLLAANIQYGVDFSAIRPVDFVASIAPRPILFIQGSSDQSTPPSNMFALAVAALSAPHAQVQTWLVHDADHVQSFHIIGKIYVDRLVKFYTSALGNN
jgi:fermentation-respiration switch protein FrsA (DUF1100 family)